MGEVGIKFGAAFLVLDGRLLFLPGAALIAKGGAEMILAAALAQCPVSFRLGIATNGPVAPPMIFRSRTTNASSNVIEQKA